VNRALERLVWRRAKGFCEYCHLPRALSAPPFQIDHIVAVKHGGATEAENLALACYYCNTHKGPNIAGKDFRTGRIVPLFNPRKDRWTDHFKWSGAQLEGRTAMGRVTIAVLGINRPEYIAVRESLIDEGAFPPAKNRD
jgi:hypothetical protein